MMKAHDQRVDNNRYTVIPRTLAFLCSCDEVLLIRYNNTKGEWSGRMNGLGGHIEQGEDPLSAMRRELQEEAGLTDIGLYLCGTILIDTGDEPGVAIYVYYAELPQRLPFEASLEGELVWYNLKDLATAPLLDDVRAILPAAIEAAHNRTSFSAVYHADPTGRLHVDFA